MPSDCQVLALVWAQNLLSSMLSGAKWGDCHESLAWLLEAYDSPVVSVWSDRADRDAIGASSTAVEEAGLRSGLPSGWRLEVQ